MRRFLIAIICGLLVAFTILGIRHRHLDGVDPLEDRFELAEALPRLVGPEVPVVEHTLLAASVVRGVDHRRDRLERRISQATHGKGEVLGRVIHVPLGQYHAIGVERLPRGPRRRDNEELLVVEVDERLARRRVGKGHDVIRR